MNVTRLAVFILLILLSQSAYAQHPTSTSEFLGPNNLNLNISNFGSKGVISRTAESGSGGQSRMAGATTITWTNDYGNGDGKASTDSNWLGGVAPQNGDEVVFDGTATDNCDWDLTVNLNALTVTAGYAGTIDLSSELLTIAESSIWTGGTNNLASTASNWSNNKVPEDGDSVVFNGASPDCTWDINISPLLFSLNSTYLGIVLLDTGISITGNLTVAGGIFDLNDKSLTVYGYLFINTDGTVNATSSTVELKGDWLNNGLFIPGTSTVILSGDDQYIYGDTIFYNLTKIVTEAYTLFFQEEHTQTVINHLQLNGLDNELLLLRSITDGQQWNIIVQGTYDIPYTDIKDMNNMGFIILILLNSVDSGNNSNVSFGGSECVCLEEKLILALIYPVNGGGHVK